MSLRKIHFLVFILFSLNDFAQNNFSSFGNWGMVFNQTRITDKWSIHSEIQFRSYDVLPNTEQLLIRGGINYHHNQNIIITGGYGWITNYKDDGDVFKSHIVNENRIWEQLILKNNFKRVFIEHRYRLEQRWIDQNYRNRIRYLLRTNVPLNKKDITKNAIFISLYNEVFIHLDKNTFDRNRLYGAMGYQISNSTNIQLGYLIQTVGNISKQYLQIGVNYNPDLRKKNDK